MKEDNNAAGVLSSPKLSLLRSLALFALLPAAVLFIMLGGLLWWLAGGLDEVPEWV